jgi:hypothetical protein
MFLAIMLYLHSEPIQGPLPSFVEQTRLITRGWVLSLGVRPGMTDVEVRGLLGPPSVSGSERSRKGYFHFDIYYPSSVSVNYANAPTEVVVGEGWVVTSVDRPSPYELLVRSLK